MGLLCITQSLSQNLNVSIDWVQNDCTLEDSLIANVLDEQDVTMILGEFDYVTTNHSCTTGASTIVGTVLLYERIDGSLAFTDFSFGVWQECDLAEETSGSLNFNIENNMITPINGSDTYGDTWQFDSFEYDNNTYIITFSNSYGDFGTTVITPTDGRVIPTLSGPASGNYMFLWSTGDTSNLIMTNEQGNYSVTVTDDMGNSTVETVEISFSHPEMAAIEAFYESTNGDNWNRNDGWREWKEGTPICGPCFWEGVTCDENGNVLRLNMTQNNLNAELEDIIFLFPDILNIEFGGNNISGTIPENIDELINLGSLSLNSNNLEGVIPPSLGNLNLFLLNLGNNNLVGGIPSELGNLDFCFFMNLEANELFGSIPQSFVNMPFLTFLRLSFNDLSGEIPMPIGNPERLRFLGLDYNNLSGPVPDQWNGYENLTDVLLHDNQLEGEIPPSLLANSNVQSLYLSNNNFSGCYSTQKSVDPCLLGFDDRDTLIEIKGEFYAVYFGGGYNFTNNPLLPWEGDFEQFCDGEDQIGAPCDDGDPMTFNDVINDDCSCAGKVDTAVRDLEGVSINIYPNPIQAELFVEVENSLGLSAELLNAIGQRIMLVELNKANNIRSLDSGVYFLRIQNEQGAVVVERLIKN